MDKIRKPLEKGQLLAVIIVSLVAAIVIIGLSLKKKPEVRMTGAIAGQSITDDSLKEEIQTLELIPEIQAVYHQPGMLDIYTGDRMFSVLRDSSKWTEPSPVEFDVQNQQLNYILVEENRKIICGDRLLITGHDYLEIYHDHDFGSPVNVILKFGEGYLAGTNEGLYYYNENGSDTLLKSDLLVTALSEDDCGLWIGTMGDGLWRYDGENWRRRYLFRDNSIFDFITTLTYSYPFLWVGTSSGIFHYDGGKWKQLFASDSSEVYEVNCFLPLMLKTYIGTEQGLFVYVDDILKRVPEFEDERILSLFREGNEILVATRDSGIFKLKGKEEILRPEHLIGKLFDLVKN